MQIQSYIVKKEFEETELIRFLSLKLKTSRKNAKRLLDDRTVFVNKKRVWMARHRLKLNDQITVQKPGTSQVKSSEIVKLFEDDAFLIVSKPSGLLSTGPSSIEDKLGRIAVHRLDKESSGCLLLAKNQSAKEAMIPLFKQLQIHKEYDAITYGSFPWDSSRNAQKLEGKTALTDIRILKANRVASHIRIKISTGRTHQIRQHLAEWGYPVLGDKVYFTGKDRFDLLDKASRQMLHASQLAFVHPLTGKQINARAPLPQDFKKCLQDIGLRRPHK